MRRPILILIIVLAVILIGGGVYLWLTKTTITLPWSKLTNTSTNTNSGVPVTITNTVNVNAKNVTLPSEVKGDTAVSGKLKVGDVEVNVSSLQKQTTSGNDTAEKGKTFLFVYFDPIAPTSVLAVDSGLRGVHITDGKTTYAVASISVISTTVVGGRGYMKFIIPEGATNLKLQLGSGAALQSVPLP